MASNPSTGVVLGSLLRFVAKRVLAFTAALATIALIHALLVVF